MCIKYSVGLKLLEKCNKIYLKVIYTVIKCYGPTWTKISINTSKYYGFILEMSSTFCFKICCMSKKIPSKYVVAALFSLMSTFE